MFSVLEKVPLSPGVKNSGCGAANCRKAQPGGICYNHCHKHGLTSHAGVCAGGDIVTGAATVISTMGEANAPQSYLGLVKSELTFTC